MVIAFFGNEKLATGISTKGSARQALLDHGYSVNVIDKHAKNIAGQIQKLKPDIGVVVAYGSIIPPGIIDIFPHGIINIHPSLLPAGRGPSPIEQTILEGSEETGVSIMRLSAEMDKGPVLAQKKIGLNGNESKQELADVLLELGSDLLIKCLAGISSGTLTPRAQSDSEATYSRKITKSDGTIDWGKPAARIEREIRAYAGWPKSRARLNDMDCIIAAADVSEESGPAGKSRVFDKGISIYAGEGSIEIKRIQPAGKKEMSVEEFLRGYRSNLN